MPLMALKQAFWKPFSLLLSAVFNHAVASPWVNLLTIVELNMLFFFARLRDECRHTLDNDRKSQLAAPIRRASSRSTRPSSDINAPRYTISPLALIICPAAVWTGPDGPISISWNLSSCSCNPKAAPDSCTATKKLSTLLGHTLKRSVSSA